MVPSMEFRLPGATLSQADPVADADLTWICHYLNCAYRLAEIAIVRAFRAGYTIARIAELIGLAPADVEIFLQHQAEALPTLTDARDEPPW